MKCGGRQTVAPSFWRHAVVVLLLVVQSGAASAAGVVGGALQKKIAELSPQELVAVLVRFTGDADISALAGLSPAEKRAALPALLKEHAQRIQAPVRDLLRAHGVIDAKVLWLTNSLAVTVPVSLVKELAVRAEVSRVDLDLAVELPAPVEGRR